MKKIFLLSALFLAMFQVTAADIDVATAQSAAQQFWHSGTHSGRHASPRANARLSLVHTEMSRTRASQAAYYIFNTDDSYIIIAGDDRADVVLAYGDQPIDMGNLPNGLRYWLECYKQDMDYLMAHPEIETEQSAPRATQSVEPLLTAMWSQEYPYYNQCPTSGGVRCLTGCAATSLSMIFYYWKYPTGPTPAIQAYTTRTLNMYLEALPPFTFDWDYMIDRYSGYCTTQQVNAMAWLMRYVGQAEKMDYGISSSGTYGWNIMEAVRIFGYDNDAQYVYKSDYTDQQWADMLQAELDASRPIEFCAYGGMGGHAFNIDGYDGVNDLYHINWGWGGSSNGYFRLNGFRGGSTTYRRDQQMIIGLEPPATKPTIRTNRRRLNISSYVDKSKTVYFTVKGKLLTGDVTVTLHDNTGSYSLNTTSISKRELDYGKRVGVTFKPSYVNDFIDATVTLSSEGADEVVIRLNGRGLFETYDPVMTLVESPDNTSCDMQWQDRTPAHNVKSYCLEVAPVPFHETRMSQAFDGEYTGSTSTDWSSRLDEITDVPGWTGYKVYRGDGYLVLGSATKKGWIETPALDMRGNNGMMTLKLSAMCTGTETAIPMRISCCGHDTTIVISKDNDDTQYCVLMPCPASDTARVRLMNSIKGKRVRISDIEVIAGDDYSAIDLSKAIYYDGITDLSYHLATISPGFYGMRVQTTFTDETVSQWSNRLFVKLDWAVGDVNRDCEVNLADVNAIIDFILSQNDNITTSACDVNGDGEVNLADVNAIIDRIISKK